MTTSVVIRHQASDYDAWRRVYDAVEPLRARHGCTGDQVLHLASDGTDLLVLMDFPSEEQAAGLVSDPDLRTAMQDAGITGQPQIELFTRT